MQLSRNVAIGWLFLLPLIGLLLGLARRKPVDLPIDAVHVTHGWADENSCVDCHDQAAKFWQTGHAQTLRSATDPDSLARLRVVGEHPAPKSESTSIELLADQVYAVTGQAAPHSEPTRIELGWCFGSGHHACTWTGILRDSSGATDEIEFRWSWFQGGTVAVTPGQPEVASDGHFGKLGVMFDGPKAIRCFACHSSYLPTTRDAIDQRNIKPGVTCQRCHGPRQAHVVSEGEVVGTAWQPTDQMDAVNRCAQCHRRADELDPQEISTTNTSLVRFQPAGLVQSKCFLNSEMTCTTCHDPHLPLELQDPRGIWQCVQCHDPDNTTHVLCAADEMDNCLSCHMPAVEMDAPVAFTDHWIRVRESVEPQP